MVAVTLSLTDKLYFRYPKLRVDTCLALYVDSLVLGMLAEERGQDDELVLAGTRLLEGIDLVFAEGVTDVQHVGAARLAVQVTHRAVRQVDLQVRQTQAVQLLHGRRVVQPAVQLFT